MKRTSSEPVEFKEVPFNYQETVDLVNSFFGWKPGFFTEIFIRLYSNIVKPLDEGSYQGRVIQGQPHRLKPVMAGPLTIFALTGAAHRRKTVLAARAMHLGGIKILDITPGGGRLAKIRPRLIGSKKRQLDRGMRLMQSLDFALGGDLAGETIQGGHALEILVEIQKRSPYPIVLIPVAKSFNQRTSSAPPTSVTARLKRYNPWNLIRTLTSNIRTLRTGSLTTGRLLILKNWLEKLPENMADTKEAAGKLRFELGTRLESETRACAGPPRPDLYDLKKMILGDPVLNSYMRDYALMENKDLDGVYKEAREYINEIASDYRVGVVRWFAHFIDWVFDHGFKGINFDKEGFRYLYEHDSRKRIVLICSHKSYIDPLLIGYSMYHAGMCAPYQAAGVNLSFWPVGWLLGHCGAFFIRRTFQGESLYREVFNAYLRHLLAGNFITLLYIEGTRSRDGKLAKPKLGFMHMLADALRMGVCEDITVMPVYLGYDKVPEEITHIQEMAGGKKIGESTSGFAKLMKDLFSSHGYSYVEFGKPMSFNKLLDSEGIDGAAEELCRKIDEITVVTGRSLAACSLLVSGAEWVSKSDFYSNAEFLMKYIQERKIPAACSIADLKKDLTWYTHEGHIRVARKDGVKGYQVNKSGRRYLEYNKNIPIGHFLTDSMISVAAGRNAGLGKVLSSDRLVDNIRFLKRLFSREFIFEHEKVFESRINRFLDRQKSVNAGDNGSVLIENNVLASLAISKLEGYLISAFSLSTLEDHTVRSRDEALQKYFQEGAALLESGVISREESISKITLANSLKVLRDMGILEELTDTDEETGKERILYKRGEEFEELEPVKKRVFELLSLSNGAVEASAAEQDSTTRSNI
ncbi:MAG: 1-acyl-sn-glycerol-3-phosphate acyltransferase [Actinobacteria bacterium]|nr:1-acyl-sn-glycerol-3-phosphate acyltransferase [Actinomycetota bacterium]